GLDWTAIGTAYVTCFFVALGTIGETVHKMTLRITGCLVGAALGIGSILLLMPSMTGFGQLCVLFGAVAFAGIWIGFGSARVSYAGWQMLLAFALTTLQGYGPTLDMQTARDRVVGILLGNVVTTLVFRFVWPVPVGGAIRADMAKACETLGHMMVLGTDDGIEARRGREAELRDGFTAVLAHAGSLIPNDRFEPRTRAAAAGRIGRSELTRLARLIVPVSVIATDGMAPELRHAIPPRLRDDVLAYHRAMTAWFEAAAAWLRTGEHRDRLRATLPSPPSLDEAIDGAADTVPPALARRIEGRAALYALTDRMITDFLDRALPEPGRPEAANGTNRSLSLATG
ncbi:MAG: FUSC family protein, partial [Gluconacetobacter diazotrophicus]|nr:FUSC family protein [Gluconacetobacter diazotrophicus]